MHYLSFNPDFYDSKIKQTWGLNTEIPEQKKPTGQTMIGPTYRTNNYLFEMIRKIIFTNYFSEFIHRVPIKFWFWKALQKNCFQSDIIFRHYVKMPPIKFWKRLTNFMISISLSEKFWYQNLITSIKVINMTGHSSKPNKLRNITP